MDIRPLYKKALIIRQVETLLLELFSQGKLNGTVHTSVGQEFSALAFAGQIRRSDFIFTNHRGHGHYIAFTDDVYGLIAELMGKATGVVGGVGGSQHIHRGNFFSNGIQGGIVPIAAGYAIAQKLLGTNNIGVVYIGDGTLGEGVVYETMNIASKWQLPLIFVCENNSYAQSTHKELTISGNILDRARAFGIKTAHSNTWDVEQLMAQARETIEFVRTNQKPVFHLVDTYRLNPHSKGDDTRDIAEIEHYRAIDPLNVFAKQNTELFEKWIAEIRLYLLDIVKKIENDPEPDIKQYYQKQALQKNYTWTQLRKIEQRQVQLINDFFKTYLAENPRALFIGEDVLSPYGGAFKVARDLSTLFPKQVLTTPISEAAITGIGNGLALAGMKPFVEIMFGDFITLTLDQIVNHASKFHHMYNKTVNCPLVLRTPMGGWRGYGPTHSQTLDKLLIGIDNINLVALNALIDPRIIYQSIAEQTQPTIVIENKLDYGRRILDKTIVNYVFEASSHAFPFVRVLPLRSEPTITIVTYGGMVSFVLEAIEEIFYQTGAKPEIIIPTKIYPLDYLPILSSVEHTGYLFVVEESSVPGGFGNEVIANIVENCDRPFTARRIGALPVPIAAAKNLEYQILPSKEKIITEIKDTLREKQNLK